MKGWILLFITHLLSLHAHLAPLIPLEPEFPLGLTEANQQQLHDNPERLEETKKTIQHYLNEHSFPWLTLVALLGFGGLGWTIYLTLNRLPKLIVKREIALSPKQKMDQALQRLHQKHFEPEKAQSYYAELASVLFEAFESQFGWKSKTLTTAELSQALRKESHLSFNQVEKALSFLTEFDQVKFAKKQPSQGEAAKITEQIQTFIKCLIYEKS
jgi:hypothetical protein